MHSQDLTPEAVRAIDKIEKLLALARNNSNEHEAENAMQMALRLAESHNLEMSLIERRAGGSSGAKRDDAKTGGGLYKWQRDVWEAVAKLNFCHYQSIKGLGRGQKYENRVIGRPENVMLTKLMADYLQGAIERITREWAKKCYGGVGINIFARDAIAYREGMATRICERLEQTRRERKAEDDRRKREADAASRHPGSGASAQSLIIISDIESEEADLNNDYLKGWELGTTARKRKETEEYNRKWREEYAERVAAEKAADELLRQNDPDTWLARQEAAIKAVEENAAASAKREAKWRRDEARREARRAKRPLTYREPKGPRSHTYYAGLEAGDSVGLDIQVGHDGRNKLK